MYTNMEGPGFSVILAPDHVEIKYCLKETGTVWLVWAWRFHNSTWNYFIIHVYIKLLFTITFALIDSFVKKNSVNGFGYTRLYLSNRKYKINLNLSFRNNNLIS